MWRQITVFLLLVVAISYSIPVDDLSELPEDTPEDKINFNEYRFHAEKKRYFKLGDKKGCNENMRFFAVPNDKRLGECDCDWFSCSRPLLYSKKTDQCHYAWSTGPCAAGEWYVFGEKMIPTCQKYPCPEGIAITETDKGSSFTFQNPKDSKCYEAGSQGYCKKEEGILMVYPLEPIPVCRTTTLCYPLMSPVTQQCIQGNKLHQTPSSNCTFT